MIITDKSNNKDKYKLATIVEIKNLWEKVTVGNQLNTHKTSLKVTH
jgi:hypothetical protein